MKLLLAAALALPVQTHVDVVADLELDDHVPGSAVGLVVPDAGPRTTGARALAALRCGEVVNSLRGEAATCDDPPVVLEPGALLMLRLPPGRDEVVPNDRRYPIVLRGYDGLLTSESTRIPGLVSIADMADGRLETVAYDGDPVAYLRGLDERIRENADARILAFLLGLALLAGLALVRPAAAVLGFAALPAANLALGAAGVSELWAVLAATGLAVAAGGPLLAAAARSRLAVAGVLAAVLAAYLAVLGLEGTWVSLSPLGPTQNGRFYGLSNLLETLLLVPALAAAALLRTWWALVAVAALALVAVAGSSFGADGGGALVLLAGYAVLGVALLGLVRGAVAVAAAAGVAALAVMLGPETHVTRSAGASALSDRVVLSLERLADDWRVAVVVALAVALLGVLVARGPRRALPLSLAAAVAVSLVVNDSPFEVVLGGLVGYVTLERYDGGR